MTRVTFVSVSLFVTAMASGVFPAFASSFEFKLQDGGDVEMMPGSTATTALVAMLKSGTATTVAFSLFGLPSGVTAAFVPASCVPTCTTVLSIQAASTTPAGEFEAKVQAVGGGETDKEDFDITIGAANSTSTSSKGTTTIPFNFTLKDAGDRSVMPGSTATNTIEVKFQAGIATSVALSVSDLPAGVSASFNPLSCVPTCNAALTINTSSTTAVGEYKVTVTASGGGMTKKTKFDLDIERGSAGNTGNTGNKFNIGDRIRTTDRLNVRIKGDLRAIKIGHQERSANGTIIGGPIKMGDHTWWEIDFDSGRDGFAAERWMEEIENRPAPPPGAFLIGDRVRTTVNLSVRLRGSRKSERIDIQLKGRTGTIIGGPVHIFGEDMTWWQIDYDQGRDGWSAAEFMEKIAPSGGGGGTGTTTASTLSITLDPSSPASRLVLGGSTDQTLAVLNVSATGETMKLERLGFYFVPTAASTSDLVKLTLWDGATKVGEASFAGTATRTTAILAQDVVVPANGAKLLSVKANLAAVGTGQLGVSGHYIKVGHDGETVGATRANGQASGVYVYPSPAENLGFAAMQLVRTYPTLERLSVPSNTLTNGEMMLYRFKVTADPSRDVGLYKFTFRVSSTTSATTSQFRLSAYTDSGFSSQAYTSNPINANDVDCVGSSSLETGENDACKTDNAVSTPTIRRAERGNHLVIYFDPITNSSLAPNAETLTIPAGQARYFELRGTVTGAVVADSVSVSLVGDAGTTWNPVTIARDTADAMDQNTGGQGSVGTEFGGENFIWSDNATTTAATTTDDWFNGYLVPGLSADGLASQVFTK